MRTRSLSRRTLPFTLAIANKGMHAAAKEDVHLRNGLNVHAGKVTFEAVAEATGLDYVAAETALG